jgi:cell division protein FtsB
MRDTEVASPQTRTEAPPTAQSGGGAVFWLLILMGLATFAPCIILPEWREYQALSRIEQQEQHRVDELQVAVDRERRLLEAMQRDPAVVARLAQRDLGFHRPGEKPVPVAVPVADTSVDKQFEPTPVEPPKLIARSLSRLPDFDYDGIFCDEHTRPIIMIMSVSLILAAVALHSGRGSTRRGPNS